MAHKIKLPTHSNELGDLTVIEKILPFDIKRVYYIYNASGIRGGHHHKKAIQALISVAGSCKVFSTPDGKEHQTFLLDSPNECLVIDPQDHHTMQDFSKDCVLLVLASEYYDVNDYIDEEYL